MKVDWNKKYTTIAVYAVIVVIISLLCYHVMHNFAGYKAGFGRFLNIIAPLIYGFSIAFILNPIVRFAEKKAFPKLSKGKLKPKPQKALSILVTFLLTLALVSLFFIVVIPQLSVSISGIIANLRGYADTVNVWVNEVFSHFPEDAVFQEIAEVLGNSTQAILQWFYGWLSGALPWALDLTKNITTGLTNLLLGIIISIYLLYHKELFLAQIKKTLYAFLPSERVEKLIRVTHTSNDIFSGFITGKLLDSLIIGILCFIGMSIFQMPMAMLVSVIVGITNIIPYFGPFIGAIPSILIIFLIDPMKAFWFAVFVLVLQQFDGNILGPKILGDSIGISAIWVILSITIFGAYFGIVGMFVGVPTFAVIYSVFKLWAEAKLEKKNLSKKTRDYASAEHPLL